MTDELEPIAPAEAVEMWLNHKSANCADSTIQSYRYRLERFLEWCEDEEIEDLNELESRDVFRYESDRRGEGITIPTLNNQIGTLKRFLAFCERIEAVQKDLPMKIEVPTSNEFQEMVNETKLTATRAEEILENYARYEYASRRHTMFALMWHTACRVGGLRSLDLSDLYFTEGDLERLRHRDDVDQDVLEVVELPFVFFQHRPDTDPPTPLKNKRAGERPVALDPDVAGAVQEYVETNREPLEDPSGRRPLFTTTKGEVARTSTSSIRREIYIITQPCHYGECPHDRDPADCEALEHGFESRCPSSRSPHPIRTGAITGMRDRDWPPEVVAERVDATPETIRLHYDLPDQIRRMQNRRKYLNEDN